jgi:hypothetical protein
MASRLQDIVDGIEELLDEPDVTFAVGRKTIPENTSPPRVSFVPVLCPAGPVKDPGGQRTQAGQSPIAFRQRPVLQISQSFDVQVWGAGETEADQIETTEQLYHDVLNAIRAFAYGAVAFAGGEWESQAEGEAGHTMFGETIVFSFVVEIPVIEEKRKLATIGDPPAELTAKLNDEVAHVS